MLFDFFHFLRFSPPSTITIRQFFKNFSIYPDLSIFLFLCCLIPFAPIIDIVLCRLSSTDLLILSEGNKQPVQTTFFSFTLSGFSLAIPLLTHAAQVSILLPTLSVYLTSLSCCLLSSSFLLFTSSLSTCIEHL